MSTPSEHLLSLADFAARIKQKHPAYTNLSDNELTRRVLDKYPSYYEHVDVDVAASEAEANTAQANAEAAQRPYLDARGRSPLGRQLNPDTTPVKRRALGPHEEGIVSLASDTEPLRKPLQPLQVEPAAPVALDPVIQSQLEATKQQARQREIQQRVQKARQVMQRRRGPFAGLQAGVEGDVGGVNRSALGVAPPISQTLSAHGLQQAQQRDSIRPQIEAQVRAEHQARAQKEAAVPTGIISNERIWNPERLNSEADIQHEVDMRTREAIPEIQWQEANKTEIDRLTQQYRQAIRASGAVRDVGHAKWTAETIAKGGAGLSEFMAGAVKQGGRLTGLVTGNSSSTDDAANTMRVHAQALQQAAMAEGADRSQASQLVSDIAGGLIGTAPEMGLMALGVPAPLAFAVGGGTRATGGGKPAVPAALHGLATGAAFEMAGAGQGAMRIATRAGGVGLGTAGVELAAGATPREAAKTGATNALISLGFNAKEIPKAVLDYTVQSPLTPEPVRDALARLGKYDSWLYRSSDGRNMSIYRDPQTGAFGGVEIDAKQADKYDQAVNPGKTSKKTRQTSDVEPDVYEDLARVLGVETNAPKKGLPSEVKVETKPDVAAKPETPEPAKAPPEPMVKEDMATTSGVLAQPTKAETEVIPEVSIKAKEDIPSEKQATAPVIKPQATTGTAEVAPISEKAPAVTVEPSVGEGAKPQTYYAAGREGRTYAGRGGVQYVADDPNVASSFAEGGEFGRNGASVKTYSGNLKIYEGADASILGKQNLKYVEDGHVNFDAFERQPEIRDRLKAAGYDAIRIAEGNGKTSIAILPESKTKISEFQPSPKGEVAPDIHKAIDDYMQETGNRSIADITSDANTRDHRDITLETAGEIQAQMEAKGQKVSERDVEEALYKLRAEEFPEEVEDLPAKIRAAQGEVVKPAGTISPSTEEPKAATVDKTLEKEPIALRSTDVKQKLPEWGSRLKTIAESKNLDDLRALADEMSQHRDDPKVQRLRTVIQAELARARQPELAKTKDQVSAVADKNINEIGGVSSESSQKPSKPRSKAAEKMLAEAERPEGKTIRPKPTHRIGAPKSNPAKNSLSEEVRSLGGIADDKDGTHRGDLARLAETGKRGTVNLTSGMDAERMAGALAERGYFPPGVEQTPNGFTITNVGDFIDAVHDDAAGAIKHYSTEYDVIEEDPDVKAWDSLTESDYGKEVLERVQSGHAKASDIAEFVRQAKEHGLSDDAADEFVNQLHRTIQEELHPSVEKEEGYSLDEDGTLLDPDGTPLFAREYQLGLPDEGGLTQQTAQPKTTSQRDALAQAEKDRREAADPERTAALKTLAELHRRGMTVDEYARQIPMFGPAPSAAEIKLLKELESPSKQKQEAPQESLFARDGGEAFYSQLSRIIDEKMPRRLKADQLRAMLESPQSGVKAEEIKWTGLDDFLKGKETVTKQEVQEFLAQNNVKVEEVTKGGDARLGEIDEQYQKELRYFQRQLADAGIRGQEADRMISSARRGDDFDTALATSEAGNDVTNRGRLEDDYASFQYAQTRRDHLTERAGLQSTKFEKWQLPGGENYRELLLTLPARATFDSSKVRVERNRRSVTQGETVLYYDGKRVGTFSDDPQLMPGGNYEQKPESHWIDVMRRRFSGDPISGLKPMDEGTNFRSGHFDEPNILAHIRFNDRYTSADGTSYTPPQKTLFIEEVQSDWHQKGRSEGYAQPKTTATAREDENVWVVTFPDGKFVDVPKRGLHSAEDAIAYAEINRADLTNHNSYSAAVPDAPFKKTWHELAMKRMLRYAAENGYDKVAWTTGEQQAERYDMSKLVHTIRAFDRGDGSYDLMVHPKEGGMRDINKIPRAKLADNVGKDLAEKILAQPPREWSSYEGLDLKVGGEGMKGFYDQILPSFMNKYGKKWGSRVEKGAIPTERYTMLSAADIQKAIDAAERVGDKATANTLGHDLDAINAGAERRLSDYPSDSPRRKYLPSEVDSAPVHSVDITPSMKQSVMEGQALFAKGEGEGQGKPEFTVEGNRIKTSPAATKGFSDAVVALRNEKPVTGGYLPRVFALKVAKELQSEHPELAAAIEQTAKDHPFVRVESVHAERHEGVHEQSRELSGHKEIDERLTPAGFRSVTSEAPEWDAIEEGLLAIGYQTTLHGMVEEALATLADGKHAMIGVTLEQSKSWLARYFKAYGEANGTQTPRQFKEMFYAAQEAAEAAYPDARGQEAESGKRDEDVPGLHKGRGEGDRESFARIGENSEYLGTVQRSGEVVGREDPQGYLDHETANLHGDSLWRYKADTHTIYWTGPPPSASSRHAVENWLDRRGLDVRKHGTTRDLYAERGVTRRSSGPLFAREDDPWSRLSDLADDFERIANEPDLPEGEKPLSLPKTLDMAGLESGPEKGYVPATLKQGEEYGKRIVMEKGIDGASEAVRSGDGIWWASTGFEVSAQLRADEARLNAEGKTDEAKAIQEKRLKFLDDFALGAVERGRSIVGIKAVAEFSPDRMAYMLNKVSLKKRKRSISPEEDARIAALGEELGALEDRNKALEKALDEAKAQAKRRAPAKGKAAKTDYQSKLNDQAQTILQTLKPKVGKFDFAGMGRSSEKGALTVGIPPLPGDAELLAQYAASQLSKFYTVADLNEHLLTEFGQDIAPYLPKIRQRAYGIRQEARLVEIEAQETDPKRRKTILGEIQKEIADSLNAIRDAQKAQEQAEKAERRGHATEMRAEARTAAKQARQAEVEAKKQIIKEARADLKRLREEMKQASKAETAGYRETIKAQREAARKAELWDTPLRNEAAAARERLKTATDAKDPQTMSDLVDVAVERFLPDEIGGVPRTKAVSPATVYVELKDEFPKLVTKKNQGEIYKRAFQRLEDSKAAAREAARLRIANEESKRLWDDLGADVDAQAIIIRQVELRRQQQELRSKAAAEFDRVSRSKFMRVMHELQAFPRSARSAIDAPLGRQGLYYLMTHPLITLKQGVPAGARGYAALQHEDYVHLQADIAAHPDYALAQKAGLDLTELASLTDPRLHAEEQHQSSLAEKLPHVRISEQAYIAEMNATRLGVFHVLAALGKADGYTWENNPEFFEQAATVINIASGRGDMPEFMKKATSFSNFLFWSARLGVSRFQLVNNLVNPFKYLPEKGPNTHWWSSNPMDGVPGFKSYDPVLRKYQLGQLVRLGLALGALYGLAKLAGLNTDNFPVVRWKNTRYDLSNGEVGNARLVMKLAAGADAWMNGESGNEDVFADLAHYGRGKLSPVAGGVVDMYYGKDFTGTDVNAWPFVRHPEQMAKEKPTVNLAMQNIILRQLLPMVAYDYADAVADSGWMGALAASPALTGVSTNTYADTGMKALKNKALAKELERLGFDNKSLLPQRTKDDDLDNAIQSRVIERVEQLKVPEGTDVGKKQLLNESLEQIKKLSKAEVAVSQPGRYADYLKNRDGAESMSFLTDEEKAHLTEDDLKQYRAKYADAYIETLKKATSTDVYKTLTDDQKEKLLARVGRVASTLAKRQIIEQKRPATK